MEDPHNHGVAMSVLLLGLGAGGAGLKIFRRISREAAMDEVDRAIVAAAGGRRSPDSPRHRPHHRLVPLVGGRLVPTATLTSSQVVVRGVVHLAVIGRGSLARVESKPSGARYSLLAAGDRPPRRRAVPVARPSWQHGLVAEARAATPRDVDRTISELRSLHGVIGVDTLTYVEVVRDVIGPVGDVSTDVDAVDLALLRAAGRRPGVVRRPRRGGRSLGGRSSIAASSVSSSRAGRSRRRRHAALRAGPAGAMGVGIRLSPGTTARSSTRSRPCRR